MGWWDQWISVSYRGEHQTIHLKAPGNNFLLLLLMPGNPLLPSIKPPVEANEGQPMGSS